MKYIKQEETVCTPYGHCNTNHMVSISLYEAIEIMDLIDKAYPNVFSHEGGILVLYKVNYNELPNTYMQAIVEVLEKILDKEP